MGEESREVIVARRIISIGGDCLGKVGDGLSFSPCSYCPIREYCNISIRFAPIGSSGRKKGKVQLARDFLKGQILQLGEHEYESSNNEISQTNS